MLFLVSDGPSDDDEDGVPDEGPPDDGPSYQESLNDLSKKWLELEMKHRTSKRASDDFWRLAKEAFPKMYRAKLDGNVHKPIPQFHCKRAKLFKNNVTPIKLEIAYLNKNTNNVEIVEGAKTPMSRFNPRQYEKLYEVATVQVIIHRNIRSLCSGHKNLEIPNIKNQQL